MTALSYGDYVEQLTYLLFLKMSHERTELPYNQKSLIPRLRTIKRNLVVEEYSV